MKISLKSGLFFLIGGWNALLNAQNLSGQWQGILTQSGKTDTFLYQMELRHTAQAISGTSYSRSRDGKASGQFTLTGAWDGTQLVLQEIEQTQPANGGWCLKYALLQYSKQGAIEQLAGDWKADRCTPGQLKLQRSVTTPEPRAASEEPFAWTGRWTGQLSQSDRDYGFFYEFDLQTNGAGESYIVSEDNGGSAYHRLEWLAHESDSTLIIKELAIKSKTDPQWKWCIKSATLRLRRTASAYTLTGDWQGYLEGHNPQTGRCAAGKLYLEKPIENQQIRRLEQQQSHSYETENGRKVRVSRVIEVQKPNIRIKVWDSGTVDGDIVTLFLNGRKILHRHRVSKAKYAIPVTLAADNNFLILHAEDLGDIPPNTIAVSVDDGVKEQMLVLSADLKTSGAVLVKQFKIEDERK